MPTKHSRRDPYRNFNFRVVIVGALVVVAGLAIAKLASAERADRDE